MTALVAHAGGLGWDELLLFAVPLVILVVLQIMGRRRARDEATAEDHGVDEGDRG